MAIDSNAELEQLLHGLPNTTEVFALRAAALQDPEVAERYLRRALEQHASSALRTTLANILMRQNRHREAMGEMVAVLRTDPNNAVALGTLTACLLECNELDRGAKMLEKTRAAGASASDLERLELRLHELRGGVGGVFAATTKPQHNTPDPTATSPQLDPLNDPRKKHQTLMGRPNVHFDVGDPKGQTMRPALQDDGAKPKRLPPPPLQSGTFAGLSTYDIEGETDDYDETLANTANVSPDNMRVRNIVSGMNDFLEPEEPTLALSGPINEQDLALPEDATAHLFLDEDELPTQVEESLSTRERNVGDLRHGANLDEYPPLNDLEALPPFPGGNAPFHHIEPDPTRPDSGRNLPEAAFPETQEERGFFAQNADVLPTKRRESASNRPRPNLDPALIFQGPEAAPSFAPQTYDNPGTPPPQQDYGIPFADLGAEPETMLDDRGRGHGSAPEPYPMPPGQPAPLPPAPQYAAPRVGSTPLPGPAPGPAVPMGDRHAGGQPPRRQETAVAATPRKSGATGSMRLLLDKKWPIALAVTLAVLFGGAVALTAGAGYSLKSTLESELLASKAALGTDTYPGHLAAEEALIRAVEAESFLGRGIDRSLESYLSIPGLSATNLRKIAISELAAVSAILEWRYDPVDSHQAAKRVAEAKDRAPDEARTAIADAYLALAANAPDKAFELLEAARAEHSEDFRVDEARIDVLLELDRPAAAASAAQPLSAVDSINTHQKYLLARVAAARGDSEAAGLFAKVFEESEDHVDARLGRAHTLLDSKESRKSAEQLLNNISVNYSKTMSPLQKAKTQTAHGSLFLASGDKDKGEDRLKQGIQKASDRATSYLPLLDFYLDQGRFEDARKLIASAREAGAVSPIIALEEAKLLLFESKANDAKKALDELAFSDPRAAMLYGLVELEAGNPKGAVEALANGEKLGGDTLDVEALKHLARALEKDSAVQDAQYQLERMRTKNADRAVVHWAAGSVDLLIADTTSSRKKRDAALKSARSNIERAVELEPGFPLYHFDLCRVLTRQLETTKAESACSRGRALTPGYIPGGVATARLKLVQGANAEAEELINKLAKQRPNNSEIGLLQARTAIELKKLDEAEQHINRWLGKKADPFELALMEGRLEFAREKYTRAANYLKEAYELRPMSGEAAVYYAHTLTRLKQMKLADDILIENLSHPIWGGYAWFALGETRRRQRKHKDALGNFSKARKIYASSPTTPTRWSQLYSEWALAYREKYRKWDHPLVKRTLDRGRKAGDPEDPELNFTYSQYYLNKRRPDYDSAMASLAQVVKASPYQCEAIIALATLYEASEESEEKRAEITKLRDANCKDVKAEISTPTKKLKKKKSRRRRR